MKVSEGLAPPPVGGNFPTFINEIAALTVQFLVLQHQGPSPRLCLPRLFRSAFFPATLRVGVFFLCTQQVCLLASVSHPGLPPDSGWFSLFVYSLGT